MEIELLVKKLVKELTAYFPSWIITTENDRIWVDHEGRQKKFGFLIDPQLGIYSDPDTAHCYIEMFPHWRKKLMPWGYSLHFRPGEKITSKKCIKAMKDLLEAESGQQKASDLLKFFK